MGNIYVAGTNGFMKINVSIMDLYQWIESDTGSHACIAKTSEEIEREAIDSIIAQCPDTYEEILQFDFIDDKPGRMTLNQQRTLQAWFDKVFPKRL